MIDCVGNGDGVILTGINVDVEINVGETAIGTDVSVGAVVATGAQATRIIIRSIVVI